MSVSRATSQHVLQVKTLYRQILKEQLNWAVSRELWLQHAMEIRYEFESNKELQDPGQIASQINRAKAWLITNKHPDPYTIPTQMGGTSFQRNTAPPLWVLNKTPDHPTNEEDAANQEALRQKHKPTWLQ